jgi:hypothetical protein
LESVIGVVVMMTVTATHAEHHHAVAADEFVKSLTIGISPPSIEQISITQTGERRQVRRLRHSIRGDGRRDDRRRDYRRFLRLVTHGYNS